MEAATEEPDMDPNSVLTQDIGVGKAAWNKAHEQLGEINQLLGNPS